MEIIKELNGKKYIVYCCDRCGRITEGVHTCSPNPVIEQLRQRVAELEKERDELLCSMSLLGIVSRNRIKEYQEAKEKESLLTKAHNLRHGGYGPNEI